MNYLHRIGGRLTFMPDGAPELAFERALRAKAPRTLDPGEWALYNQWVAEQRTLNQKETKT